MSPQHASSPSTTPNDVPKPPAEPASLTPAMRQYWEQKRQAPDAILLFRMGDFYELFYDDAERAHQVLGITLTSRDRGKTPLAGIPYHALEQYLGKLVRAGFKVAISEQIEDAKQAKGVVNRAIVRIVTPGTLTDDGLLEQTRSNLLAAVCPDQSETGIATLELSTGELTVQLCEQSRLIEELGRIEPAEVVLPEWEQVGRHPLDQPLREQVGTAVSYRPAADFNPHRAEALLTEQFEVRGLIGFGFEKIDASLQAAGALLAYVRETQKGAIRHLRPPRRQPLGEYLILDSTTLRSLEVERTLRTGSRSGSLLAAVDATRNPMGARLMRHWLCYPLRDVERIRRRQRLIAAMRQDDGQRAILRAALRQIGDVERMVGRLGVQRTTPRELRALGDSLAQLPQVREALRGLGVRAATVRERNPVRAATVRERNAGGSEQGAVRPSFEFPGSGDVGALAEPLEGLDELAERLTSALSPEAPPTVREGGIFAGGHNAELDRLRSVGRDGQQWLAEFQAREMKRTGIPTLKVGFNKVFGYYIEVTNPHRDRVPTDYVRKQTIKNAERFITDELKNYESEVLSAESRANELEYELFNALRDEVATWIPRLQQAAGALARIDVLAGWAEISVKRRYCRPEFVNQPLLEIEEGRHPVLDVVMDKAFVPNDTALRARQPVATAPRGGRSDRGAEEPNQGTAGERDTPATEPQTPSPGPCLGSLALITGPNMAGKSTYIRQVALLTLLAHAGCWVPARRMRLGVVDRIFTRVGASDELTRGQSTFMVEMLETANILHNATLHSLVILDEIGRGTSTFDGISLAWAITEHLSQRVGCRALFATHYHELTELGDPEGGLDNVFNLNVAVREYEDRIVFLHRIVPGAADRSYGLHVAKLAGVPRGVLERSNAVLNELEQTFGRESKRPVLAAVQRRRQRQLRLFEEPEEQIVRQLRELDAGALESESAIALVRKWRRLLGADGGPADDRSPE